MESPLRIGINGFGRMGRLALRAGLNRIILRPDGPLKRELADVRGIRLVPVAGR